MRLSTSLACGLILVGTARCALAAPEPARGAASRQADSAQWNVRVEVLMVAMPQDKLLALLPDLRDPKKIDEAVAQLMTAIQRKEAILTGYPVVQTLDGKRVVSETILEKKYPTEFEPPLVPQNAGAAAPPPVADALKINDLPLPTAFEVRNLGVSLEVEPHVSSHGETTHLRDVVVHRVELLGFDAYDAVRTASGKVLKIDQPQFFSSKVNTSLTVQNGQRTLIAVHLLPKPENYMEVFILQAFATPIK